MRAKAPSGRIVRCGGCGRSGRWRGVPRQSGARHAKQGVEFYVGVAIGAGDGGAAGEILLHKGAHHALLELILKIEDVMRKIQVLGYALGVVDVV